MLEDVITTWGGHEVTAIDVYRDMYHFGEGYLQNENEEKGKYKANPVAYWRNEGKEHGHYDRINTGTGHPFQSEVYVCRGDQSGKKLDRRAMLITSRALGHNRVDVIAQNYLYKL